VLASLASLAEARPPPPEAAPPARAAAAAAPPPVPAAAQQRRPYASVGGRRLMCQARARCVFYHRTV